ncbi:MAG TPA: hypothetical protein PKH54_09150 [Myxococcota bacterium]|nr:hypothetical protein [Myxococcota bacterium]HOA13974.1 hypothetical protein [Myxococcota bacterium]HOD00103.1 hypothetical protein [Myxococcota bacterium]HOH77223.1 hypothetical protein [Myxococcota bacterium]HPV05238.1 hypothetical protein [Myxococcota bacterium]
MRLFPVTAFAGVMMLLVACGNGSGDQDVVGGDNNVTRPDNGTINFDVVNPDIPTINKECQTNLECQEKNGGEWWACQKCETEWKCVQPAAMGEPGWGCVENVNCGSEAYCHSCENVCKPLLEACQTCENDEQCAGQMSHCVDKVNYQGVESELPGKICAPWCPLSTKVCAVPGAPQGSYVCADIGDASNGVCVPATMNCDSTIEKCESDEDCEQEGFKCYTDLGICGCRDALSCELGQACHPVTHQCMMGCADDNECGNGTVCSQGLCVPPCTGTLEKQNVQGCTGTVPDGYMWDCDETGHCFVPGMCFQPSDCKEPATYCDAETHKCLSGCMFDFDCKTFSQICDTTTNPGTCIRRPCKGNYSCSCGEVCELTQGECQTAEGNYCAVCDQQADDPCGNEDTLCIGFQDKDGNDMGSYCMPPCSSDPDNLCPQGWQCQEVKNQDGSPAGKVCVRHCYQKVAGGCAMGDAPDPQPADGTTSETATADM